jgi:hypothetical protein
VTFQAIGFTEEVERGLLQTLSSAVKVPALYLLSVAICFPLLYIVLVLMGARLRFVQTLSLILLAITLNAVLLASCAPIADGLEPPAVCGLSGTGFPIVPQ